VRTKIGLRLVPIIFARQALLTFLKTDAVKIPVSAINIGPVHKRDIMRAGVMLEKKMKKYAVILAFDVPVSREATELAEEMGVKIMTADIIYHLFDQFTEYLKVVRPHFAVAFVTPWFESRYVRTVCTSSSCGKEIDQLV
jgi:translation initiation factor IF-2